MFSAPLCVCGSRVPNEIRSGWDQGEEVWVVVFYPEKMGVGGLLRLVRLRVSPSDTTNETLTH